MIEFVYSSRALKPFTHDELMDLLAKSRTNNESLGITGMLLYKEGEFMQVLEGDATKVSALSARIAEDPRHTDFVKIMERPCTDREFPDWSMGFQDLNEVDRADVPGYTTFLNSPLRSLPLTTDPTLCRRLLLLFKNKNKGA
jgi:Sensors of blue-light using FAD